MCGLQQALRGPSPLPLALHEVCKLATVWPLVGIAAVILPEKVGQDACGEAEDGVGDSSRSRRGWELGQLGHALLSEEQLTYSLVDPTHLPTR